MFKNLIATSLLLAATLVQADQYTPLALPTLNTDIRAFNDGSAYQPLFPSAQNWNGVPFTLSVNSAGHTAFAAGVLDIPVGLFGVTQAFTIINSAFGAAGANNGSVEFIGTNSYFRVDLIQGVNTRDHFDGNFNNGINGIDAVPAFNLGAGRARLDQQIYNLPSTFAQDTLETIRFTGLNSDRAGIPFISAATVLVASPVPELPSYALVLFGLGCFGLVRRQRFVATS